MSFENSEIAAFTFTIIALGCWLAKRLSDQINSSLQDVTLGLGLLSGTGVLLAMGSVEMAGRYGYTVILGLIAYSLIFVFAPLIFSPIRRLNQLIRFATPVDFLTFRFRSKSVAIVACSSLILVLIPLILAQIVALESVANYLFGRDYSLLILLLILTLVLLVNQRAIHQESNNNRGWMMTAAGLLLLPALGLTAWTSVQSAFGGIAEMNQWVVDSGQRLIVQRMEFSYSLFSIFLAASFACPINFSLLVSDNISDRQAGMTSWAYPLLVLLVCIPVFPMLWSGIATQPYAPWQDYLYALPTLTNHPLIAALGSASIILLALSFTCSLTLTAARISVKSFLLPNKNLQQQPRVVEWIERHQMLIAAGLALLCIGLSLIIKNRSITDYYLAGFAGLAQLAPGMIAVMYLPGVNRQGFIAGLVAGISVWLLTIALPLLFGDWSLHLPLLDKTVQLGMQNWNVWAIEALLLNITLCIIFSVSSNTDEEQEAYATVCMADNVYIPARVELAQKSVPEMTEALRLSLGDTADIEMALALKQLRLLKDEIRPAALRQLRDSINASLNRRFGVLAANRIMEKSLPVTMPASSEPDDIYLIESLLAINGGRLTGIASELNKLRMHHREILDNLPIGVISVDPNGEIVKWNAKIANYTGINAAIGSYIADLPEPWCSAITNFISSGASTVDELRLEIDGQVRWYGLQMSDRQLNSEPDADIVLLVEDQTNEVTLIQKSIDNERLASVGRLAAGVAHEIGNPVTGIACLAQNLEHETEASQISESAKQILSQTDRINRIVQSLISFSKGGKALATSRQLIKLRQAADEAIALLRLSNSPAQLEYLCDINPELRIYGDYHQLLQVLLNLLSNARDASPDGGIIQISASIEEQQSIVNITDQGSGIEDNLQDRLFEPFVTTKDPGRGTGLGLWIVFNLVKSLGAEVTITSPAQNSDCGTTVRLCFPLSSVAPKSGLEPSLAQ